MSLAFSGGSPRRHVPSLPSGTGTAPTLSPPARALRTQGRASPEQQSRSLSLERPCGRAPCTHQLELEPQSCSAQEETEAQSGTCLDPAHSMP